MYVLEFSTCSARQSGLTSGWVGDPSQKDFDFSRQIKNKNSIFFRQKFPNDLSFSYLLQNVRLLKQYFPFTAKFWANYSISLEKSSFSNMGLLPAHDKI